MAASPRFKVYDRNATYQASCHEVEAAALLMTLYGDGATIRNGHTKASIVWTEGTDGAAYDSYDNVVEVVFSRL